MQRVPGFGPRKHVHGVDLDGYAIFMLQRSWGQRKLIWIRTEQELNKGSGSRTARSPDGRNVVMQVCIYAERHKSDFLYQGYSLELV